MPVTNKLLQKLLLFLVLASFVACDTADDITEIRGKIIDVNTNKPAANIKIDLVIGEGLDGDYQLTRTVKTTVTTNSEGEYAYIFEANRKQSLYQYALVPGDYEEVEECGGIHYKQLNRGKRNLNDIKVERNSVLSN